MHGNYYPLDIRELNSFLFTKIAQRRISCRKMSHTDEGFHVASKIHRARVPLTKPNDLHNYKLRPACSHFFLFNKIMQLFENVVANRHQKSFCKLWTRLFFKIRKNKIAVKFDRLHAKFDLGLDIFEVEKEPDLKRQQNEQKHSDEHVLPLHESVFFAAQKGFIEIIIGKLQSSFSIPFQRKGVNWSFSSCQLVLWIRQLSRAVELTRWQSIDEIIFFSQAFYRSILSIHAGKTIFNILTIVWFLWSTIKKCIL